MTSMASGLILTKLDTECLDRPCFDQTLVAAKPHRITADQIEAGRRILRRQGESGGTHWLDQQKWIASGKLTIRATVCI